MTNPTPAPPTSRDLSRIATLHPALQPIATRFLAEANAALAAPRPGVRAVRFGITQAFRSYADQAALFGQGRTEGQLAAVGVPTHFAKPNAPRVSNARPGMSLHERMLSGRPASLAFDIAPFDAKGQPLWAANAPEWAVAGEVGERLGLTWGGRFKSIKDLPHFELHI